MNENRLNHKKLTFSYVLDKYIINLIIKYKEKFILNSLVNNLYSVTGIKGKKKKKNKIPCFQRIYRRLFGK